MYQLEEDLGKVKELVIKSFNNVNNILMVQISPTMNNVPVDKLIEGGKQIEIEELERFRKKLNNHDNMISLLMDT